MLNFTIVCENDHSFNSYFASRETLENLLEKKFVECPECGSTRCEQGLSAPNVSTKSNQKNDRTAAYRDLINQIERNTEDLGEKFTDEAIAMHEGETEERPIRGQITSDDVERLDDAGVDYIPYIKPVDPKRDLN